MTLLRTCPRLPALLLLTLTGCAGSGALPPQHVALPAPPTQLQSCFTADVPPPKPGQITERQAFALIAALKASADGKDACGQRWIAFYQDLAMELAK